MKTLRIRCRGFSLVEMMVAIGLLSLVILVLFSLFNQTTKAMRANANQTDVLEGARSGLEILNRDLENMAVSGVAGAPNFFTYPNDSQRELFANSLTGLGTALTPIHYDLFFLQRVDSKRVKVVGFVVRLEDRSNARGQFPVGTLYRYEDPEPGDTRVRNPTVAKDLDFLPVILTSHNVMDQLRFRVLDRPTRGSGGNSTEPGEGFLNITEAFTNLARVADGVVSFRVTPYDQFSRPLDSSIFNYAAFRPDLREDLVQPPLLRVIDAGTIQQSLTLNRSVLISSDAAGNRAGKFPGSVFLGEQVPTTVEIELAMLEPRALDQLRLLSSTVNASGESPRDRYIKRNLGKIQIFRQRVPIRVANHQ